MTFKEVWGYIPEIHFAHKTPLKQWELEEILKDIPVVDLSIDLGRTGASICEYRRRYKKKYGIPTCHDKIFYETFAISRSRFKKKCEKKGWIFEQFREVLAGYTKTKTGLIKKYYYKLK